MKWTQKCPRVPEPDNATATSPIRPIALISPTATVVLTARYRLGYASSVPWEKQFDRGEALDRAVRIFWKRGYENSSMDVLLKGMGIQKGSFYATFQSKHQILLEALRRYVDEWFAGFNELARRHSPLTALRSHLDDVVAQSTGAQRVMGCFVVNSALELAPRDPAVRVLIEETMQAHREFYRGLLEQAKTRGELPDTCDTAGRSAALLALVLGMRVMARGNVPAATIRAVRQQAEALLTGA